MDETEALLHRLARIEGLDRRAAPAEELLVELRALVREAEAWARREGDERAEAAVETCRSALGTSVR
jgi:hypothetical protein